MRNLPASKARDQLADILNEVAFKGQRVILNRHGKDVAAIVSVEDLRLLQALEDRLDLAAARRALAEPGGKVPWDELRAEVMRPKKR
jgi:prevent-host-death family protein